MPSLNWNPPPVAPRTATYEWGADYAAYVHEGTVRADGTVTPPRRWTDYAIAQHDPAQSIAQHFQQSQSVVQAFDAMASDLNDEFKAAIEAPIWSWDRATVRRNGQTVTSPRDIVDTGELRDSQSFHLS